MFNKMQGLALAIPSSFNQGEKLFGLSIAKQEPGAQAGFCLASLGGFLSGFSRANPMKEGK
jgi:hypothetical protein